MKVTNQQKTIGYDVTKQTICGSNIKILVFKYVFVY